MKRDFVDLFFGINSYFKFIEMIFFRWKKWACQEIMVNLP